MAPSHNWPENFGTFHCSISGPSPSSNITYTIPPSFPPCGPPSLPRSCDESARYRLRGRSTSRRDAEMSTKPAEQFHVTALMELLSPVPNKNSCVGGKNQEHCGRSAHVGKSGVLSCVSAVIGAPCGSGKSVTTTCISNDNHQSRRGVTHLRRRSRYSSQHSTPTVVWYSLET